MAEYDPFNLEQWVDNPGCEPFEIATAMRSRGALSASGLRTLDAHLATCASCRAHSAATADADRALTAALPAATGYGADIPHLLADKFRARLRRGRRNPLLFAAWMFAVLAVVHLVFRAFDQALPFPGAGEAFVAGISILCWLVQRWKRGRLLAIKNDYDVVAAHRASLEKYLARERSRSRTMAFALAMQPLFGLSALQRVATGDASGKPAVVIAALWLAATPAILIWARRHRRRVENELAEMR